MRRIIWMPPCHLSGKAYSFFSDSNSILSLTFRTLLDDSGPANNDDEIVTTINFTKLYRQSIADEPGWESFGISPNAFSKLKKILFFNDVFGRKDFYFGYGQQGVNFINIKCTKNSYECRISASFSSYMYVEKWRSYEIFVCITLMKLTTGVNFTNILKAAFLNKRVLCSFSVCSILGANSNNTWHFRGRGGERSTICHKNFFCFLKHCL